MRRRPDRFDAMCRTSRILVAVAIAGLASVLNAQAASAVTMSPISLLPGGLWSAALQWTSNTEVFCRPGAVCDRPLHPSNTYLGWAGVKGFMTTPDPKPAVSDVQEIWGVTNMQFSLERDSHIQLNWWISGTYNPDPNDPPPPPTNYKNFLEIQLEATGSYWVNEYLGIQSTGATGLFEISYDAVGSGCWSASINGSAILYRDPASGDRTSLICLFGPSGAAVAGSVIHAGNLHGESAPTLPDAGFGSADGIGRYRLKGAAGWEDWDRTLVAGSTGRYDTSPCPGDTYYISHYAAFYYFRTYGGAC